jgi:flagellar protein FlaI
MDKDSKGNLARQGEIRNLSKYWIDPIARSALAVGAVGGEQIPKIREGGSARFQGVDSNVRLIESYDGVEIVKSSGGTRPIYNITLPELKSSDWKKIRDYTNVLGKDYDFHLSNIRNMGERKKAFSKEALKLIKAGSPSIPRNKLKIFTEIITNNVVGYGILEFLLSDDRLEEIMLLGENKNVYVFHRLHGMCSTNIFFDDDEEVLGIINKMASEVGRKIDFYNPLLDARLLDGSRVNATVRPITPGGATLTIRKFSADPLTVIDLIKNGTLSIDFAATLWIAVDGMGVKPANILVSGGTSSGKTTTLNTLATFIPEGDRVITIEDTVELQLNLHDHWIQMETRPTSSEGLGRVDMNDCLINTLRMRPDRIIVGEVRGAEAETMFIAMNTGHDGCMGTLHANDSKETITRLTNPPMKVPMVMLPALDLIIIHSRFKHPKKGYIRRIIEVSEVAGMEEGKVLLNKTFSYNIRMDKLVETGTPSRLQQDLSKITGISAEKIIDEIDRRSKVLKWMVDNNKRSLTDVNESVILFNRDQNLFMEKINIL